MGSNIAINLNGKARIIVDSTKCIECGLCLKNCEHSARHYRDSFDELLDALDRGEKIDLLIAPSFFLIYDEKVPHILGYLRSLGFKHIYDVSNGANLCSWAYAALYEKTGRSGYISSTCPAIVNYIEKYKPELIDFLAPIKSPVQCLRTFLETINEPDTKYAFLCPCVGKQDEVISFDDARSLDYCVMFSTFQKYLSDNRIHVSSYSGECDLLRYPGLAAFYPLPGGLKANLNMFMEETYYIKQIEGQEDVYPYLDAYAEKVQNNEDLPFFVDILNCKGGCIEGSASSEGHADTDDLNIKFARTKWTAKLMYEHSPFDPKLDSKTRFAYMSKMISDINLTLDDFLRTYNTDTYYSESIVTMTELEEAYKQLHKFSFEDRNINCTSCGYNSCKDMAIAICHKYNSPENCVHYMKDTLEKEQRDLCTLLAQINPDNPYFDTKISSEDILQSLTIAINTLEEEREKIFNESQAKNQFFASMTHELRTPLNAIINMADTVKKTLPKNVNSEDIDSIRSAGENLLETINELLDISKLNSGKFTIINSDYDLNALLKDVYGIIKFRALEKNLDFDLKTEPSLPSTLIGDSKRIRQILINLLGNAVKYTPKGSVTLDINWNKNEKDPVLFFSVIDTGVGIKQEDIPFLFSAFSQVDEAKNHNIEGTGLGLSISDALSKEMGGSIRVESEYGKGSTFTLSLPQTIDKYVPLSKSTPAPKENLTFTPENFSKKNVSILVVDDISVNLKIVTAFLSPFEPLLSMAQSGEAALALCKNQHFDIILMDYQMPGLNGIQTLRRLRESDYPSKDSKVILLTAEEPELMDKDETALFDSYVSKPIVRDEVLRALMGLLKQD